MRKAGRTPRLQASSRRASPADHRAGPAGDPSSPGNRSQRRPRPGCSLGSADRARVTRRGSGHTLTAATPSASSGAQPHTPAGGAGGLRRQTARLGGTESWVRGTWSQRSAPPPGRRSRAFTSDHERSSITPGNHLSATRGPKVETRKAFPLTSKQCAGARPRRPHRLGTGAARKVQWARAPALR